MRILLLADIHSNWTALQAINEPHDICLFLGDLVDYGVEPGPCIEWVRRHAHHVVRGNHDHGAAQNVIVNGKTGFKYLSGVTRVLTRQLLSGEELRYLASMPLTKHLTIAETRYLLVHATPRDPMEEYASADVEFWSRRLQGVDADVICVGHTHLPFVLEVGDKLVINPGSVGQPRDGDPRGAYAVIEGSNVELKRFAYPVDDLVRKIEAASLESEVKSLLREVYVHGRGAQRPNGKNGTQAAPSGASP